MVSKEQLIAFRDRVAAAFEAKQIKAPVHLNSDDQADHLIRIFQDVRDEDWIFGTWRSAFHCLLKGWPEEELFQEILAGRSMYLMSSKYRVLCSSIVGGHLPIAAGVALGIKRRGGSERVWCFLGDMCAMGGLYAETVEFVCGHNLPITFVHEDNGLSTDTPTDKAWYPVDGERMAWEIKEYVYERNKPHTGIGKYVSF